MKKIINKLCALQELDLEIGERATCTAGYPHKGTIVIECIKDFNSPKMFSKEWDDIINNPYSYIRIIDRGKYGALTSHYISSNWKKL